MLPDNQILAMMFESLGCKFLSDCVRGETNPENLQGFAEIIQEKAKGCESILGELSMRGYL